ncbi:MAG: type VI secretion system baseplate subunit TssF [Planctomycetota bacterium]
MTLNSYYDEELRYLRQLGRDFARERPEAASLLESPAVDPDVERLLEGVAFLCADVRRRLDADLSEYTQALIANLWPHLLHPVPAATILRFRPEDGDGITESVVVRAGSLVDSIPVADTPCTFRTTEDCAVRPLRVVRTQLRRTHPAALTLYLECLPGATLASVGIAPLRLFLGAAAGIGRELLLLLCERCTLVELRGDDAAGSVLRLDAGVVRSVGLGRDSALVSYPDRCFDGLRLVHEYFCFPDKFCAVELAGWNADGALAAATRLELAFMLEDLRDDFPQVPADAVQVNCVPAVNLFERGADPVRPTAERNRFPIRPSGHPGAYEVHSIRAISGTVRGVTTPTGYLPVFSPSRFGSEAKNFYQEYRAPTGDGQRSELELAFVRADPEADETLSIDLWCTNHVLPQRLAPGDIATANPANPGLPPVTNLFGPSRPLPPPALDEAGWSFIGHVTLDSSSFASLSALRGMIDLNDMRARADRQAAPAHRRLIEALIGVETQTVTRLIDGLGVRGTQYVLTVEEAGFGGPGALYLFAVVLREFLAQSASVNTFTQLCVVGSDGAVVHQFAPRFGRKAML